MIQGGYRWSLEGRDEGASAFISPQEEKRKVNEGQLVSLLLHHLSVSSSPMNKNLIIFVGYRTLCHVHFRKLIVLASLILQLHTSHDSEDRWLEHKSGIVNVKSVALGFLVKY